MPKFKVGDIVKLSNWPGLTWKIKRTDIYDTCMLEMLTPGNNRFELGKEYGGSMGSSMSLVAQPKNHLPTWW